MDYVYDHDGIRVGKTLNGTDVIKYVVDKNRPYAQVLEEQWSNGALSATTGYVYGDALLSRTTNGTPHYYLYDGMGSTRTLTDATGAVTDTYSYDAFGNLLDKTGSTINPYLYRGEQYDADLSSYYLRARYYQPGIGRFLTTDPMEGFPTDPLSQHKYVYGNCNPVGMIDPSGKLTTLEQVLVGGIILSGATAIVSMTGVLDGVYEKYGDWLPDAAVFGVSGSANLARILPKIFEAFNMGHSWWYDPRWFDETARPNIRGGGIFGIEFLFSIHSAQIAVFGYGGAHWTPKETKTVPTSLYKAWVWNLWNADNYSGAFITVNIGPAMLFCNGWWSFFWNGPYGVGYSITPAEKFRKYWGGGEKSFLSISYTFYKGQLWKPWNLENEWEILPKLIGAQFAFMLIHSLLTPEDALAPVLVFPIEASWTYITCRAKSLWNRAHDINIKKETPDTLSRQEDSRPEGWRSGPINAVISWVLQ